MKTEEIEIISEKFQTLKRENKDVGLLAIKLTFEFINNLEWLNSNLEDVKKNVKTIMDFRDEKIQNYLISKHILKWVEKSNSQEVYEEKMREYKNGKNKRKREDDNKKVEVEDEEVERIKMNIFKNIPVRNIEMNIRPKVDDVFLNLNTNKKSRMEEEDKNENPKNIRKRIRNKY